MCLSNSLYGNYLTKPFKEQRAHRPVADPAAPLPHHADARLRSGDLTIDVADRAVKRHNEVAPLTQAQLPVYRQSAAWPRRRWRWSGVWVVFKGQDAISVSPRV